MKPATLLASSLLAVLLIPAAAADISLLGGTVIVHTEGDPGVSALGSPLARVSVGPCFDADCVVVYSDPAGASEVRAIVLAGACSTSPGDEWEQCIIAALYLPADLIVAAGVLLNTDPAEVGVCARVDCVYVTLDPLCVRDVLVGEIVCET